MRKTKINVAIIGLGFGTQFIPIYKRHPNAEMYAICRRSKDELNQVGDAFNVEKRYTDFIDVLNDPNVDFVHINTPIHLHGSMSIAALKAGKHVMCTVPMSVSVEECEEIVTLVRETGLKYMMAETVLYSREYLFVKEMFNRGEFGTIQFLQGSHHQDMEGWPIPWPGLPPMHYATHCISPCLAIINGEAASVSCFGSGQIDDSLANIYGSPFSIETSNITVKDSNVIIQVYRSLFNSARQYRESFNIFGSLRSIEWPLIEGDGLVLHTAKKPLNEIAQRVFAPDFAFLLPDEIRHFTTKTFLDLEEYHHLAARGADPDGSHSHLVLDPGSLEGHGGSHPHLVHEFISSLLDDRDPYPNATLSANITCAGILSHQSAMNDGLKLTLPEFTFRS